MQANVPERLFLFVKEAAARLRVSPTTIRRHIATGDLEAVRLGEHGRYRVRREALDEFLRPTTARTGNGVVDRS